MKLAVMGVVREQREWSRNGNGLGMRLYSKWQWSGLGMRLELANERASGIPHRC